MESSTGMSSGWMLSLIHILVEETMILPDEAKALKAQLIRMADGRQVNLVLTTGGTGFSPRAVSYTHLDVYKRQKYISEAEYDSLPWEWEKAGDPRWEVELIRRMAYGDCLLYTSTSVLGYGSVILQ